MRKALKIVGILAFIISCFLIDITSSNWHIDLWNLSLENRKLLLTISSTVAFLAFILLLANEYVIKKYIKKSGKRLKGQVLTSESGEVEIKIFDAQDEDKIFAMRYHFLWHVPKGSFEFYYSTKYPSNIVLKNHNFKVVISLFVIFAIACYAYLLAMVFFSK